jgi:hypothetical protein
MTDCAASIMPRLRTVKTRVPVIMGAENARFCRENAYLTRAMGDAP